MSETRQTLVKGNILSKVKENNVQSTKKGIKSKMENFIKIEKIQKNNNQEYKKPEIKIEKKI